MIVTQAEKSLEESEMAAVYVFGATVAGVLTLTACLTIGLGAFQSVAACYLGAMAMIVLIVMARLRATRYLDAEAGHDGAGYSASVGPSA